MKALGIKGTYEALRSASGTAQHLMFSVWGVIAAGGFFALGISDFHLIAWVSASIAVMYCTVWAGKTWLLWALRVDVMITLAVLLEYFAVIANEGIPTPVFFLARLAAASTLLVHGLYLSNLVRRQILEHKQFADILEVEFTSDIK